MEGAENMDIGAADLYNKLEDLDYVRLEEKINSLQKDEKIKARREALPEFIWKRLRERSEQRLDPKVFTPELLEGFLKEDPVNTKKFFALLEEKAEELQLSQKKLLEIRRAAKAKRASALETLREALLGREAIRFREEAQIAAKNWNPILNAAVPPGEILLERISRHLNLTQEQQAEFNALAVHRVFYVSASLRREVGDLLEKTGMNASRFRDYAFIGKDAWQPFQTPKTTEALPRKTSQETLLKLIIGFGLEEEPAWAFMETAGGTFMLRIDLVFLACVCCGYQKPLWVMEILDFFAEDEDGNILYGNPYK